MYGIMIKNIKLGKTINMRPSLNIKDQTAIGIPIAPLNNPTIYWYMYLQSIAYNYVKNSLWNFLISRNLNTYMQILSIN